LIAQLDKLGMRGRKAQSAMEDDEVARVRAALAARKSRRFMSAKKKSSPCGQTEEEGQGSIEARETVVERRFVLMSFAGAPAVLKWLRGHCRETPPLLHSSRK